MSDLYDAGNAWNDPWVLEAEDDSIPPRKIEDLEDVDLDPETAHYFDDPAKRYSRLAIAETCEQIQDMLLEKNRKYGNSALEPTRIFSKSSPVEQLKVRIDDKLSRVISNQDDEDEDIINDLIGYLILLKIAQRSTTRIASKSPPQNCFCGQQECDCDNVQEGEWV